MVDDHDNDDHDAGAWVYYKLTFEPSAHVSKTKASIQSYLNVSKGYVEQLERNYIDIWGFGRHFQRHFKESGEMEA